MVLAAGRGNRLRPLTDTIPKPLVQVAGVPLIDSRLAALSAAGVTDVVINVAYRGTQIIDHVGDGGRWGLNVHYSDEGEQALETGGGVARALPMLGDAPFLVCNADAWSDMPMADLVGIAADWPEQDLAHLVVVPNPNYRTDGDFALHGDRLTRDGPLSMTFSGYSVLHPDLLAEPPAAAFALAPLLFAAADQGRLSGAAYAGRWCDVGTPQRLAALEAELAARQGQG